MNSPHTLLAPLVYIPPAFTRGELPSDIEVLAKKRQDLFLRAGVLHIWLLFSYLVLAVIACPRGLIEISELDSVHAQPRACSPRNFGVPYSQSSYCAKILDFRGFDSSIISILRGGTLMSIGNFLESLSQAILVGIILVGRLGVLHRTRVPSPRDPGPFLGFTIRASRRGD